MDFDDLECFVKIAELKSFTRAAESLFLTQPSISKKMADLEKELGIPLVDRTKRRVELTRAGESLLSRAKELLSMRRQILNEMKALSNPKAGGIRIGGSNIPGRYILPQILTLYKKRYEGVGVALCVSDSTDIVRRVEASELDLGFVGIRPRSKDLESHRILKDRIVLIGPKGSPGEIELRELKKFPLLSREVGSGTRRTFEQYLTRSGLLPQELRIVAELSDTEAIKKAVRHGLGLSYVSAMAIEDAVENGSITVIRVWGLEEVERYFYMIRKKGRSLSPQLRAFMETVKDWAKNET
jgi:DNA-binding transcriptional LysR family regulator